MRGLCPLLLAVPLLADMNPRPAPRDYPVHASDPAVSVAAEFHGRSLPGDKESHLAGDFLVVEAAVFPALAGQHAYSPSHFRLRINGKKDLAPTSPGYVAARLRRPDWETPRGPVVAGGVGDATVIVGAPRRPERYPGDPDASRPAPGQREQIKVQKEGEERDAGDAALKRAFPETQGRTAAAGLLFFGWDQPVKKAKSIELIYDNGDRKLALKLQ